jgi:hypothetical protein
VSGHDPYAPESGDPSFDVDSYDVEIDYRVRTNRLEGRATINAVAATAVSAVSVDLVGLRATKVRVDGDRRTRFSQGRESCGSPLPHRMQPGERFSIEIAYAGARTAPVPLGHDRLGGARGRRARGVAADRRAHLVPLQRPPRRARRCAVGDDGCRVPPVLTGRPTGCRRRRKVTVTVGVRRARWRPTSSPCTSAGTSRTRSKAAARPSVRPGALRREVARAFADVPRMLALFEESFGAYPQEACTLVVTPDELEIPLEAQGLAVFGSNHLVPTSSG